MIKTRKIIIGIMTMIVFSSVTACSSSTNNENSNMISSEEISSEDMTFLDQHENTAEEATDKIFTTEEPTTIVPEFPDTRVFDNTDADFQPEGAEQYEVDEAEPLYHVTVENLEEMYKVYDDYVNCVNLKYYLDMYFLHFTGDDKARYVVTLTDGTCVDNEYGYLTLDAICDVYPDITLHIQYDKLNKVFGIKSELGDLSMEAQIANLHKTDESDGTINSSEISQVP